MHDHVHEQPQAGEPERSPAQRQSSVMLDIGGEIGALVIHASPEWDEAEIDISPGTDPVARRSHNQVHPRRIPGGTVYSAVYPSLHEGDYTIWRDPDTPEATVTIAGGEVTEYRWTG
jgi:hypothetical protein